MKPVRDGLLFVFGVALAKARPGQIDYSSSGSGISSHLAAELFSNMAGVKMTDIPLVKASGARAE